MLTNRPQPIELNELISRLKKELLESKDKTQDLFLIGRVELELSFTVERNMNGGIDLQVVQTGVEKTISQVQTIKVSLEPIVSIEEMRKSIKPEQKTKAQRPLTREYKSNS
jgi:hypothetical protein